MNQDLISQLAIKTDSKIVFLIIDGLGGLPDPVSGLTELETAQTPNLDRLAEEGTLGLSIPIDFGITPGSGPAHLSLFGYDPLKFEVGRGILDILGVNFDMKKGDVAARVNFCTVDKDGSITDRRAGRIPDEEGRRLCKHLHENISLPGVETFIIHTKEYRGGIVLRGEGLSGDIPDTDPQVVGEKPLPARARSPKAEKTADLFNKLIGKASKLLAGEKKANMILVRGIDTYHPLPQMQEIYKLNPVCIAAYPMYRGLAKLVGMKLVDIPSTASVADEFGELEKVWDQHDFVFLHIKKTDSAGEDGDFDKKVHVIEEVDREVPRLFALAPDVIIVTGDHSTPSLMKSHSWHPLPTILWSGRCRRDGQKTYGESSCQRGGLGTFNAQNLMALALANAAKLLKFGA
jgi:2,3-bisphosphoglycerate-independent phosphoglycerate mutase